MSNRFCLRRILSESLFVTRMIARRIFLSKGVSLLPQWIVSLSLLVDRLPSNERNLLISITKSSCNSSCGRWKISRCVFHPMFIFEESTWRIDHDAKCLNRSRSVIVRFECAFIPRCVIHASVIFKESNRCEILEEGITERNFCQRNERNRLLFATRIETILFRMIKNQYVFLSHNVLSTFRLFSNKVNTNGINHRYKPIRNTRIGVQFELSSW